MESISDGAPGNLSAAYLLDVKQIPIFSPHPYLFHTSQILQDLKFSSLIEHWAVGAPGDYSTVYLLAENQIPICFPHHAITNTM